MIIASLISLTVSLYCYAISQLQQHNKLKWQSKDPEGFWGRLSNRRKYNKQATGERFFLSTTLLVFLTDGYHFMQFWFFNFLALSVTFALGFNWWILLGLMVGIRLVHWAARKLLSK